MANGGIYDQEAGGFFRYSTSRDWSIPHFEKMLEDNAKLLMLFANAYQVANNDLYLKTIWTLMTYVNSLLRNAMRGGFYGSQDADEHFYSLPIEEREHLDPPYIDRSFYTDWNAMMVSTYINLSTLDPLFLAWQGIQVLNSSTSFLTLHT